MMAYAETTSVPVSKTKGHIEKLVKGKYGATAFGIMEDENKVQLVFRVNERNIMFKMLIPDDAQEERSIWRAMLLTIKGKFESAERGIETFEEAFLANIMLPDGRTVAETAIPAIESGYQGNNVPLLPNYGG